MRFPPEREDAFRITEETADIPITVCRHELEAALADLAGVDRRSPEIPESIRIYTDALLERLRVFPSCSRRGSA